MSYEIQITDNKLNVAFATSVQSNDIKSTSTPKAFVLGGQPGAGKSTLISEIVEELNNNVVIINGDEYRKLHPHYKELQKEYGKDAPQHTAKFAGMMTEAVLNKAIENKYNIVIEGTFRTAETPIKTLELFKIDTPPRKQGGFFFHSLTGYLQRSIRAVYPTVSYVFRGIYISVIAMPTSRTYKLSL